MKLYRSILDSPNFKSHGWLSVYLYLHLQCNDTPLEVQFGNRGQTETLNPGTIKTTISDIAHSTGVNETKVWRILKALEEEGEITIVKTDNNYGSIITVNNIGDDNRPTDNDQEATLKEECREREMLEALLGSSALAKSCEDQPFDYAMKLRTGELVHFSGCTVLSSEWLHLWIERGSDMEDHNKKAGLPAFDRGLDVRLKDIVWVADAPHGS